MGIARYHLGCPIWGSRGWVGLLFAPGSKPPDFLRQYASVFNAVEGNTTFYGVPAPSTVEKWSFDTPPGFHFCFKFPRVISHEKRLIDAEEETDAFLSTIGALDGRLGPTFLQLPPSFGPDEMDALDCFLARLPQGIHYAVEVRHRAFFTTVDGPRLNEMLARRGCERVILDSRGVHAYDGGEKRPREVQRKMPDLPVSPIVLGGRPFVRFIAHPEPVANRQLLVQWAEAAAGWIDEGRTPHFFFHAPDDRHAPLLARTFHQALSRRADVGDMPAWPGESNQPEPEQLDLFG